MPASTRRRFLQDVSAVTLAGMAHEVALRAEQEPRVSATDAVDYSPIFSARYTPGR